MARRFEDLSEREILALAITPRGRARADLRRFRRWAARRILRRPPGSSRRCRAEESEHRASLIELFRSRFGEHIPLIRRSDVKGFIDPPAGLGGASARSREGPAPGAAIMELEARRVLRTRRGARHRCGRAEAAWGSRRGRAESCRRGRNARARAPPARRARAGRRGRTAFFPAPGRPAGPLPA